ncbi:mitochondrial ribosome and complex I assembly factor AltMIEF1 [Anopheles bellator]|uniref:mitochondrial ribosome and complex I assembly factor AltMIEF1 n=1 Tax=Anopheles bellator TaxID=139047 RepID=UPI002649EDA8|nr:mitochondrial ribosome and complex I assembly factor AltMIEF1 [Anopheles bellator]
MNVCAANRLSVLSLYRDLLRYGAQLKYTDKDFFRARIRAEFRKSASLSDPKEIDFCYKKGRAILERDRVI